MSYDIQEINPIQLTLVSLTDPADGGPGPYWINGQDDTDYIITRTIVLYPSDQSVLNQAEKSFTF
jgi:hypothetical protein